MIIDLTTKLSGEQIEQWLEKSEHRHVAGGHIGTHLDTYCKTAIPLDYFKSRGVLVDAAGISEEREIGIGDMENADIRAGDFVLIRTARIEHHPYGSAGYFKDHPQLSDDLIGWLIEKKIHFIGVDCCGIRRADEHGPADRRCEEGGVYVIENLCNLQLIGQAQFTVYTMWLDDPTMTGLKCRVIAEME